jgi:hypothetical protein
MSEEEHQHQLAETRKGYEATLKAAREISDAKSAKIKELLTQIDALEARNAELLEVAGNVTKFLRRKATEKPLEYKGQVQNLLSLEQALREV